MDKGEKPTLAICIPAYDPQLTNHQYLRDIFNSLESQSEKPNEIIITSNIEIEYIPKLISQFPKLEIIYRVLAAPTAASNFNNCANIAESDYLKFLCQDDFFISINSIQDILKKIRKTSPIWIAQGSKHFDQETKTYTRKIRPKFKKSLVHGINRIGSPSAITVKRSNFLNFDENLKFAYDCDWYLRMFHHYGKPQIYKKNYIGIRLHNLQATKSDKIFLENDLKLIESNHKHCKIKQYKNCTYFGNHVKKN